MTAHYYFIFSSSLWTPWQNASFHKKVNVWVKDLHFSQLSKKKSLVSTGRSILLWFLKHLVLDRERRETANLHASMSNRFTASVSKGNVQSWLKPSWSILWIIDSEMVLSAHGGHQQAAWLKLTVWDHPAHSDAESGAHWTPPSNPWQMLRGTYLELLIAFALRRKCDPHQWEGYAFCQNMSKEVRRLLLYCTLKVTVRLQSKWAQGLLQSWKGTDISRFDFWASLQRITWIVCFLENWRWNIF